MSSGTASSRMPSITVRPSPEEKRLFAALAAKRGISESKLALIAVRSLIRDNAPIAFALDGSTPVADPGTDRLTIRLRPGDPWAVAQRAACKVRPSKYVAMLVRGHLLSNPPLVTAELEALKLAIVVADAAGKLLAAARKIAREKFRGKHRYAMVLHTDQRHPHLHIVLKAESIQGPRLHIDKAMPLNITGQFSRENTGFQSRTGTARDATRRHRMGWMAPPAGLELYA
jgi:hypothetical protein